MAIDKDIVIENLRKVFDPEISCNVYDLGLIYDIAIDQSEYEVTITHTLTSAFCPYADQLIEDVEQAVSSVEGVDTCKVEVTFDPPFGPDKMTEEVRMVLGIF